jgi:hypothetical protein
MEYITYIYIYIQRLKNQSTINLTGSLRYNDTIQVKEIINILYVEFKFFYACIFIWIASGSFVPHIDRHKPFLKLQSRHIGSTSDTNKVSRWDEHFVIQQSVNQNKWCKRMQSVWYPNSFNKRPTSVKYILWASWADCMS